jgi:quercetin dioxygenase-like cupin family protein
MDSAVFEGELKRDGFTDIETRSAQPNVFSPLHSHPCDIRALVMTGELTLQCEGVSRTYRAGDTVVLAAGCEHAEQNGPEGYSYIIGRRHVPD